MCLTLDDGGEEDGEDVLRGRDSIGWEAAELPAAGRRRVVGLASASEDGRRSWEEALPCRRGGK